MATEKNKSEVGEISTEEKLIALYQLQQVHSEIDKILILRGELPLEVQDLEDEIEGLETRIENYKEDAKNLEISINGKKSDILHSNEQIKKYQTQQDNVRNNREYDSLSKEIEFQTLEIELSEKKIREFSFQLNERKESIEKASALLEERKGDLDAKKKELDSITSDTEKEKQMLQEKADAISKRVEERLLNAYTRIRNGAQNHLGVVTVQRDACGGCFNKIPPQRQLDIRSRKKIIVCEYCGRILVDSDLSAL
ncbi:MAG: C4-type zinc ribbon domain-containing protein [Bacteroidales bacterium]|nr:C4-type zinc ribbon domain-containing protein [Bacteroidales bacterium]